MATSDKKTTQPLPKPRDFKCGNLFVATDGDVYMANDEDGFMRVFASGRGAIGTLFSDEFSSEENLVPFEGTITLTEGK